MREKRKLRRVEMLKTMANNARQTAEEERKGREARRRSATYKAERATKAYVSLSCSAPISLPIFVSTR